MKNDKKEEKILNKVKKPVRLALKVAESSGSLENKGLERGQGLGAESSSGLSAC